MRDDADPVGRDPELLEGSPAALAVDDDPREPPVERAAGGTYGNRSATRIVAAAAARGDTESAGILG